MTAPTRRIYLLDPKKYSPETIAVAFAKTSRSPEPFDRIADELSDSSSAEFHEKWVVGYGHSSVAEHAVLHIAVENISRLAIESIESNRLASFTEKSTRYQKWSLDAYIVPPEIIASPVEPLYRSACDSLMSAYQAGLEKVGAFVRGLHPRREGESDARWDARIRVLYVDICRYLLPAASLANVGVTINARTLEHAIRKMLSHPLAEVRAIGEEIKRVACVETPTLVKYADPNIYLRQTPVAFREEFLRRRLSQDESAPPAGRPFIRLIQADPQAESLILAAAATRFLGASFEDTLRKIATAPAETRRALADTLLLHKGKHDTPLRELEHAVYTFEAMMDQGAYFEVKRHRMMTQTPGPLTFALGYAVPYWIAEAGFRETYDRAMEQAAGAFQSIQQNVGCDPAGYLVPNACFRRLVFTMNLREACHFCALRSSVNAHPAVRILAREAARQIKEIHPLLGSCILLDAPTEEENGSSSFFLNP